MRHRKLQTESTAARAGGERGVVELDEYKEARQALALFNDYQEKKKLVLRQTIDAQRDSLPIKALEGAIVDAVRQNRVVLIFADTGAGKSTQVPQYLLAAGFQRIAVTQPRRIACTSLARRVSQESSSSDVAYQVRFDGNKKASTRILFLTEGVLLRQLMGDQMLSAYDVIVIDEVHERHMNGDFLLGILKGLLGRRDDIRLVLMSATINAELFSKYFDDAPFIMVPGRMYPVSIEYIPATEEDRNLVDDRLFAERVKSGVRDAVATRNVKIDAKPYLRVMDRIDQLVPAHERGDLLVFVSGINEIELLAEEMKAYASANRRWIILLLHSSLSVTEQEKAFDIAPAGVRKCILSTNIAETSVTIDGVRFVIDSGKMRDMAFDPAANLSRLSEFWISQSSAKQRAGRAGRTGPGQCFRFYSKKEYSRFNEFPVPEILRMPLEPLLLQIRAHKLGDPRAFDFIERPAESTIAHSLARLQHLGALDPQSEEITAQGLILAAMPMDVTLGKMLILGSFSDLASSIVIVAAALSVQSPFLRVGESQKSVLENRKALLSSHGDPFTLLNIYNNWIRVKGQNGESSRSWSKRHGIEEQRLYEMHKLKGQFEGVLRDHLGVFVGNERLKRPKPSDDSEASSKAPVQRLNWQDPEYRQRRDQRRLLEKQKQLLSSGRRKVLRVDEDHESDEEGVAGDVPDLSIDALEFALKHGKNLDTSGTDLDEAEISMLKIIICSGLYPHLAIPDDANHLRNNREQIFHTKAKRFVSMHPSSVFFVSPEHVYARQQDRVLLPEASSGATLASLHAHTYVTEMLCYLSLLETHKPFLLNVVRVPALGACLLFARSMDFAPDHRRLVIDDWLLLTFDDAETALLTLRFACFLRVAWTTTINTSLDQATKLRAPDPIEETIEMIGTRMDHPTPDLAAPRRRVRAHRKEPKVLSSLPPQILQIRHEWNDALAGQGEFAELETADVSLRLADFLALPIRFTTERLKTQELPELLGYHSASNALEATRVAVTLTPFLRVFIARPR
ncbi:DEAH (Asp-Glu-Ala-His) box polypeptide 34 [Thoreauomyces humboldtii]|nr:DEAH (Asp-Glu-Ala-His) box polypeptide 34 [Thoreauomyces humboldtii]